MQQQLAAQETRNPTDTSSGRDTRNLRSQDAKVKRLERELYYYKKRSRDLKKRLSALQSESEQENASLSIKLSHRVEGDVISSTEVAESVATSAKSLTVSCNIRDVQPSVTQSSIMQSSVAEAKTASIDTKGSKWIWKPSDSLKDIASLRAGSRDSLDLEERGRSKKSRQGKKEEEEEEEEEEKMDACCKKPESYNTSPNDLTAKGSLKKGTDLNLLRKEEGPTLDICGTRHAMGLSGTHAIISTEDEVVRKPKKQLRLLRSAAIFIYLI